MMNKLNMNERNNNIVGDVFACLSSNTIFRK